MKRRKLEPSAGMIERMRALHEHAMKHHDRG
jgi:hypothetical protein